MSAASLLSPLSDPGFEVDHNQMHRQMFAALPAGQYSAQPYMLDPVIGVNIPAGWWNFNHATSHSDFADAFPAIIWSSRVDLVDINLSEGSRAWWRLSNKLLHDQANTVLKPSQ